MELSVFQSLREFNDFMSLPFNSFVVLKFSEIIAQDERIYNMTQFSFYGICLILWNLFDFCLTIKNGFEQSKDDC
jgi:hypothetical protein